MSDIEIEIVDRADGCKGSFCIRRIHARGYAEYWDARSKQFCAFGTVMTEDCAIKVLKQIQTPSKEKV